MEPPSTIPTNRMDITNCWDCLWFWETVETTSPRAVPEKTYRKARPQKSKKLPWKGTRNQNTPAAMMLSMLNMAMRMLGAILPNINSVGRMGVTRICSMVPVSRSRTTAAVVRTMLWVCRSMAARPGMRNQRSFMSGL